MNFIKEYLPLLIAITSASLAYLYARRNNNFANFYNQSKESLEDLLGPMYFRLKHIMSIEDLYEKEARLEEWFNDYNPSKVPIHKLGSQLLIKKFLILQEMFPNLGKKRLEIEEEFYKELESVYKNLEKRYWSVFNSLYKDYNWYNRIINTYFTWRVF
ncbi:hypothetical protein RYX51_22515 (plasmid) [Priestia filamentosa]|nr:hypothetical protein RYX51_22515 [Priestia filamentosa]